LSNIKNILTYITNYFGNELSEFEKKNFGDWENSVMNEVGLNSMIFLSVNIMRSNPNKRFHLLDL